MRKKNDEHRKPVHMHELAMCDVQDNIDYCRFDVVRAIFYPDEHESDKSAIALPKVTMAIHTEGTTFPELCRKLADMGVDPTDVDRKDPNVISFNVAIDMSDLSLHPHAFSSTGRNIVGGKLVLDFDYEDRIRKTVVESIPGYAEAFKDVNAYCPSEDEMEALEEEFDNRLQAWVLDGVMPYRETASEAR